MSGPFRENYKRSANRLPSSNTSSDVVDIVRFGDEGLLTTNASGLGGLPINFISPSSGEVVTYDGANLVLASGTASSTFTEVLAAGNTYQDGDSIVGADGGLTGASFTFTTGSGQFGGNLTLRGGGGSTTGGKIDIQGGAGDDNGGVVNIIGGIGRASDGQGHVNITGGEATVGEGAKVILSGGRGATDGGAITLNGGEGQAGPGGNVEIRGGPGSTTRGDVIVCKASGDTLGFFGVTPVSQQSVTGSPGGNAALQNLLTALDNLGIISDDTS